MKTKRKVATLAATLVTFGSLAGGANAEVVYAYYDGIISESSFVEAPVGDFLRYVIALDNGGDSLNSQTWSADDVQSVTFYASGGAIDVEFSAERGEITGSFTSDAGGNVTAIGEIGDLNHVNSSNIESSINRFYINGNNAVFLTDANMISEVDVANNLIASNWTLSGTNPVHTNPVPEPSSALLLGFGVLGAALHRRRTA